jgi:hypothetical protein
MCSAAGEQFRQFPRYCAATFCSVPYEEAVKPFGLLLTAWYGRATMCRIALFAHPGGGGVVPSQSLRTSDLRYTYTAIMSTYPALQWASVSVFQLMNHFTDFHETWNECYAIEGYPNVILLIPYNLLIWRCSPYRALASSVWGSLGRPHTGMRQDM